jgi:putative phage-type endonuclease
MGFSPWKTPWEVWAEKKSLLDKPSASNQALHLGVLFENALLDDAEKRLGAMTRQVKFFHKDIPLAATIDGLIVEQNIPVEAKTTGLVGPVNGGWGEAGSDEIPEVYQLQVHAQLACTRAEMAYVIALIAGRGIVTFNIKRDDQVISHIEEFVVSWWQRHIIDNVPPDATGVPRSVYSKFMRKPGKTIRLPERADDIIDALDTMKEERKYYAGRIDELESNLLALLGDAERGLLPSGKEVTYFSSLRKSHFVDEKTVRTLRIKKAKDE